MHVLPRLGHLRLGDVTEDHLACLVADPVAAGYSGSHIANAF